MAEQTFEIVFDGYWREPNKSGVPSKSGIYCVYECTHNVTEKTVTLHQLLYIGQSEDVNKEIASHKKLEDWTKHVRDGKQLCYSFAPVDSSDRLRIEAALIFKHKPIENTNCKENFPYDKTTIISSGSGAALLNTHFTLEKTP